ncbi:MAG: hypothetical protein L0206_04490 [Actinobacteria bacterium]|nr:hypothetical protein [Actinomycetota bacterium]
MREAEVKRGERERTVERRSVKRLRALVIVLTVAALVAAALTAVALNQTGRARRASGLAVARELAAAASANLEVDRELAILLALEALRTARDVDQSIDPRVEEVLRRAAPAVAIDTTSTLGADIRTSTFTPDGTAVAIVGLDGSVGVWDLTTGARSLAIRSPEISCGVDVGCPDVFKVALSDDASLLATGDDEGRAHVWDLGSGREILTVVPAPRLPSLVGCSSAATSCVWSGEAAPQVAVSPDGSLLATGTGGGTVQMWDIATGKLSSDIHSCDVGTDVGCWQYTPEFLAFSPDGTRLFFEGAFGGPARIVDVTTGETFSLPPGRFWDAIRADESRFAYAPNGRIEFAFGPNGTFALFKQFGPNGTFALSEQTDPRLRNAEGQVHPLEGHTLPVVSAAFDAEGTRLATGSLDGMARVWDATTADLIFTSPVEPSDVAAVAFTPDGSRITAVYSDGRIIVHPIALEDAIEIARARVTRGLTDDECRRYLHSSSCSPD